MTVPLLPRPKDPKDDWGAQKAGFSPVKVEDVRRRLALAEHLAPGGIASPWAQLHFVNWMLEDQKSDSGREATEVLRLVVLLQYLGHLEAYEISVASAAELGWLSPLLENSWVTSGPKSIVLWKIRDLGTPWNGQVFAGSHPAIPFFPGAAFYPDRVPGETEHVPAWKRVREALIAARGPRAKTPLLDEQGEVADPHVVASLSAYLARFLQAVPPRSVGWAIALTEWQERLKVLGQRGRALPVALSGVSVQLTSTDGKTTVVPFGSYTGASPREVWTCPKCEEAHESWINIPGQQGVSRGSLSVFCPRHPNQQILTGAGEPVGPEDYGAYPAPDETLYVWTDEVARPVGSIRAETQGGPGSDGTVVYRFNRQRLEVKGRLVSLDTVVLRNVARMARRERTEPTPVDVPVSGEHAVLVRKCESDPLNRCWKIGFNGLRDPVTVPYPPDQETLWGSSTIVIWPPDLCEGWSVDYVAASTPRGAQAAYRLIEQAKDSTLEPSPVCFTDALYRTKVGSLRYIEVGEWLADESFRSMGLLNVVRRSVPQEDSGGRGQIVLDFGTSNSAVLWEVLGADSPGFVLSGEDPAKPAHFATYNESDFNNLLKGVYVLSPWNRRERPPRPFLPSLHAKPDPDKKASEPAIPPRGQGLDLLFSPAGEEPRIVSGLKWKDWRAPGIQSRLESLIEILLLPAFWELRARGCSSADLTATYPLAFGEDRRGTYENILQEVTKRLSQRTGLRVDSERIVSVSESAAGSSFLPQTHVTHVVALDAGGATTDLAIHIGEAGRDVVGKEVGTVLAADSIEYAGRDFLRAIVVVYGTAPLYRTLPKIEKDLLPPETSKFGEAEPAVEAYVASLEALLHRRGVEGLYELLKYVPQDVRPADMVLKHAETILRWEALLAGLLFYIRRVVKASIAEVPADKHVEVNFNLLGQGWELLRILGGDITTPATSVLEPRFRSLCEGIAGGRRAPVVARVLALPEAQERKKAVAAGAAMIRKGKDPGASGGTLPPPIHALAANNRMTFVGMNIYDSEGQMIVSADTRLQDLSTKPHWPGDPGYGRLLDELFEAIPELIPGTRQSLRSRVREFLLTSAAYRAQFKTHDIRQKLIDYGQNDFIRGETWPAGSPNPARSLLAGFLTSVWRPVWSSTKL